MGIWSVRCVDRPMPVCRRAWWRGLQESSVSLIRRCWLFITRRLSHVLGEDIRMLVQGSLLWECLSECTLQRDKSMLWPRHLPEELRLGERYLQLHRWMEGPDMCGDDARCRSGRA